MASISRALLVMVVVYGWIGCSSSADSDDPCGFSDVISEMCSKCGGGNYYPCLDLYVRTYNQKVNGFNEFYGVPKCACAGVQRDSLHCFNVYEPCNSSAGGLPAECQEIFEKLNQCLQGYGLPS